MSKLFEVRDARNRHIDFINAENRETANMLLNEKYDEKHTLHECNVKTKPNKFAKVI